jgi:hypothetical protein
MNPVGIHRHLSAYQLILHIPHTMDWVQEIYKSILYPTVSHIIQTKLLSTCHLTRVEDRETLE